MLARARFSILRPLEKLPPRAAVAEESLRARALLRLLPAQVHRLRNALAVVQGVCELAAQGQSRVNVQAKLALMNDSLERLALLARTPSTRTQVFELQSLFRDLDVLLRPLERSGVELELRAAPALVQADERLAVLVLDACVALLAGGGTSPRRRLRLHARATPAEIRLVLTFQGAAAPTDVFAPLADYAVEFGWPLVERVSARAAALRLLLPALPGSHPAQPRVRSLARPLLLVHRAREERELLATVLTERGHTVEACAEAPARGSFTLALLERRLVEEDPDLPRRLRARLGLERVELLPERLGPDALLALVGEG